MDTSLVTKEEALVLVRIFQQENDGEAYQKLRRFLRPLITSTIRISKASEVSKNILSPSDFEVIIDQQLPEILKRFNTENDAGATVSTFVMTQVQGNVKRVLREFGF